MIPPKLPGDDRLDRNFSIDRYHRRECLLVEFPIAPESDLGVRVRFT